MSIVRIDKIADKQIDNRIDNQIEFVFISSASANVPFLTTLYDLNGNIIDTISGNIPENWKDSQNISGYLIIGTSASEIGEGAFYKNKLTSVVIPNTITNIGNYAFAYNRITSLNIPDSVENIGEHSFRNNLIEAVILPSGITTIAPSTFFNNKIVSINIPNSVTTIQSNALYYNQLNSINIPTGVTDIGFAAFASNQLSSITIPSGVTTIGNFAFSNNTGLHIVNSYVSTGSYPYIPFNSNIFQNTSWYKPLTIYARFDDNTWTTGVGLSFQGNNNVTVIKSLI